MKKKPCISCGINSKLYIYPLLLPIFCTCLHFGQELLFDEPKYKKLKYHTPLLFYYFFPKLFSFFCILIMKCKTKNESNDNTQNKMIRRYHLSVKAENSKKIFLIIYLISLLEVIYKEDDSLLLYFQNVKKSKKLIEKRTGFIISVPIFSYFILNKKPYRHHYFAILLSIIGCLFINISRFFWNDTSSSKDGLYHFINILFSFAFALSLVLIKFLMGKFVISPYVFLFYDGLFCILNLLLCTIFEYFIIVNINDDVNGEENDKYWSNNFGLISFFFKETSGKFYCGFFLSFFASFGYFICNVLTIDIFTPYLNVLTDFITPSLLFLIEQIYPKDGSGFNYYEFIGYIIVIIGASILNEIIILNFFGLNVDTYSNISNRSDIESNHIQELSPNNGNDELSDDGGDNENDGETTSNEI
jgi:drug/metabolite transporter (DMT)-like permease